MAARICGSAPGADPLAGYTGQIFLATICPECGGNRALNKISGSWDDQLLARMLADLQASDIHLTLSGPGEDELLPDKAEEAVESRVLATDSSVTA